MSHKVDRYFRYDNIFFCFFFLNFCWTHVHLWGHWYPCFGLLMVSPLGFKARVGSALFALGGGIRNIRSLRFTSGVTPFASVYCQHSSQLPSPHACFSRGGMPGFEPPTSCSAVWCAHLATATGLRYDNITNVVLFAKNYDGINKSTVKKVVTLSSSLDLKLTFHQAERPLTFTCIV